jgi:hypothetical protein
MTAAIPFILSHWHTVILIVGSLLAIFYVYKNRHKLWQTKTYNRRNKP